jgi:hypothetical protein
LALNYLYVREQLQKIWDNGIITANSEISNNENGSWANAIDFFIKKNKLVDESESVTATSYEFGSGPPKKSDLGPSGTGGPF